MTESAPPAPADPTTGPNADDPYLWLEDVAGDEAGPQAGQTTAGPSIPTQAPAARSTSGGASEGLGIAALILGALGLIAGLAALPVSRRKTAGGPEARP